MPTENFITIFADRDFKGGSIQLKEGFYDFVSDPGVAGPVGNDNISSIKIPEGWVVTAYVDSGLKGASREFTNDVADLGNLDDKISSMSVRPKSNTNAISERRAPFPIAIHSAWIVDDQVASGGFQKFLDEQSKG